MNTRVLRKMALAIAGTVAVGLCTPAANAAEALWISATNWSYSAAYAASPAGAAYFWGLSVGAGTFSFAYAYSNDGALGSAYAFAEASAGGLGGFGAVQVGGLFADPYAGVDVDTSFLDPSLPGSYPETKPGSDPLTSGYTVNGTNITFTSEGSKELHGDDELEAFVYNGNSTDAATIESELGAGSSPDTNSSSGDVTSFTALMSDLGLEPLDAPADDPSSLTELNFTENTGDIDAKMDNVILVGIQDADVPTPAALPAGLLLLGLGGLWSLARRRRVA